VYFDVASEMVVTNGALQLINLPGGTTAVETTCQLHRTFPRIGEVSQLCHSCRMFTADLSGHVDGDGAGEIVDRSCAGNLRQLFVAGNKANIAQVQLGTGIFQLTLETKRSQLLWQSMVGQSGQPEHFHKFRPLGGQGEGKAPAGSHLGDAALDLGDQALGGEGEIDGPGFTAIGSKERTTNLAAYGKATFLEGGDELDMQQVGCGGVRVYLQFGYGNRFGCFGGAVIPGEATVGQSQFVDDEAQRGRCHRIFWWLFSCLRRWRCGPAEIKISRSFRFGFHQHIGCRQQQAIDDDFPPEQRQQCHLQLKALKPHHLRSSRSGRVCKGDGVGDQEGNRQQLQLQRPGYGQGAAGGCLNLGGKGFFHLVKVDRLQGDDCTDNRKNTNDGHTKAAFDKDVNTHSRLLQG
jgi:hypothetical protein